MKREILINANPRETRVAILEDDQLVELLVDRPDARRMVGDIYLGKVEAEVILTELLPYFPALIERSARPTMRFSGPNASPALRQMASWKLSFGRNA